MHALGHFKTITHHKLLVMGYCFRVGLIRQGLMHDMSKYSWTEFHIGAKYYTGTRSPNALEREAIGYSTAWLHHKGRNRHHLEYWIDYGPDMKLMGHPMPTRYMVELCLDRIAACRVYHGKDYTDRDPLDYLNRSKDSRMMHPETKRQVVEILTMLAEEGEKKTLQYIRRVVLKNRVEHTSSLKRHSAPEEKDCQALLAGQSLLHVAKTHKTPFYIYSEEQIKAGCAALREAFSWNPGHKQFFPVKATPTAAILRLLQRQGQGVVCSSKAELELCTACGFTPEEIMFLPNYPLEEDVAYAGQLGCRVTLDSLSLIESFGAQGLLKGTVGLRVNPGGVFRTGTTETWLDGVKFGIAPQDLPLAVERLRAYGVTSVGLHGYLCGNTLEPDYYPALAGLLGELALDLHHKTGIEIGYLNISGGLGIPYRPREAALSLREQGMRVRQVLAEKLGETSLAQVAVYTELGRYLLGSAGALVTQVIHIKRGQRNFAGVDASAADLMRPMMYGAYHHITVAGKEGAVQREPWDVVGAVCETTDRFAENRALPPLQVGDVLLIHDAGAHGHSMGYNYGGRLRCAEYLLREDGSMEMIRRAETTADYLAAQIL